MRFLTPIDRVIQAGGERVTILFWLLAVGGAIAFALPGLPEWLAFWMAGTGTTVFWMRWQHITVGGLVKRIIVTRARGGDLGD